LKKPPSDPKNRQFLELNRYRRERVMLHVYLLSGTRFTGRLRSFDVHTLLLETQQGDMVMYAHAISTIEPALNVRGRRAPGAAAPARRFDIGGAPRRMPFSNANQLPAEGSTQFEGMPETDPDVEFPPPAPPTRSPAPTVTIVRRRSRLVQK
jgi:host factor-I protein